MTIPVSVIVLTLNEEQRIGSCLAALQDFSEIFVVDSNSRDNTAGIAREMGAQVIPFEWSGAYPKKKQWAIDHCPLSHDFVFLVDADELIPPELVREIAALDFTAAGYFIRSKYMMGGRVLHYGAQNKKLCLFDRHKMEFPVVDDLGDNDLGEVEGHYQPVFKNGSTGTLKTLKAYYLHDTLDERDIWTAKHERYARWESEMNHRGAWPQDPNPVRQFLKRVFRGAPCRGLIAFMHSYIYKLGFIDGVRGLDFAQRRRAYYKMIGKLSSR